MATARIRSDKNSGPLTKLKHGRIIVPTLEDLPKILEEDAQALVAGLTDNRKQAFVLALAQLGNRQRACRAVGISGVAIWKWRKEDAAFKAAYDRAMEIAVDLFEDELVRRAAEGYIEPVFHKGEIVGGVRKYSDNLLMFLLKGARPDKYAERQKVEVSEDISIILQQGRQRALERAKQRIIDVKPEGEEK